jgi:DNA-binding Lrp family transcriptional regulator
VGDLDQIDLALIECLRVDGRTPNKSLAQRIGIAEATVAARIRQLREDKVMFVTLRRDLYSKGYDIQCFVDITVQHRNIDEVAADLALIDAVGSVLLMLGTPEIIAVLNAVDREDLYRVLEDEIGRVEGITRVELHIAVDIRKYQAGYANLEFLEP